MKLFVTFTIFMGVLAGLLLANSCDDVNHEKLPGGARKDDFQSKADFKEELKNYRKSSCEKLRKDVQSCEKLRKVAQIAESCAKLRKSAQSCEKLRKVAQSCAKL